VTHENSPVTLGRALDVLEPLLATLRATCPALDAITIAGDVRRFEPIVSSLVLLGRAADPSTALEQICASDAVAAVLHHGDRRAILVSWQHEIDVRVAAPHEYGTMLFIATGSRRHVRAIFERYGRPGVCAREEETFAQLGLPFIPAEMRSATGEIEAAAAGRLPALLSREHIRGDLHMHTTFSDGRDTPAAMIEACHALEYEYVAITDHSERAAAGRTLTRGQIGHQRDEISSLRERFPDMAILHGVEVDIMPDGRLDFADSTLEEFDIVLASLHDDAGQDRERLTGRCTQAMRHPLVTILTHPANRLVGHRGGYDLDFDALYAAAAETGTALEVDGAPAHLDLDGERARAAVSSGVTLTVDSDCHRAQSLERQMILGIGTARRGWVEPRHVLNTRPIGAVREFIAAKRSVGADRQG
jgi:DNA polymerase (family 10)